MEPRLMIAYGMVALIALFLAAVVLRMRYLSRDRTVARDRRREHKANERRKALREDGEK